MCADHQDHGRPIATSDERVLRHTFTVSSDEARFLLVVEPAGFENFLLALSEPAQSPTLPPADAEPPALDAMVAAAATFGARDPRAPRNPKLNASR